MAIGVLEVFMVGAKGLRETDFLKKMDPYVVVEYKGQQRLSTVAKGEGQRPTWNEKIRLRAEYPGNGKDYKINLKIMDKDTFSEDDFVGESSIYIKDLLERGVKKGRAEIQPTKYVVTLKDKTYHGEITVGCSFELQDNTHAEHDDMTFGGSISL